MMRERRLFYHDNLLKEKITKYQLLAVGAIIVLGGILATVFALRRGLSRVVPESRQSRQMMRWSSSAGSSTSTCQNARASSGSWASTRSKSLRLVQRRTAQAVASMALSGVRL